MKGCESIAVYAETDYPTSLSQIISLKRHYHTTRSFGISEELIGSLSKAVNAQTSPRAKERGGQSKFTKCVTQSQG